MVARGRAASAAPPRGRQTSSCSLTSSGSAASAAAAASDSAPAVQAACATEAAPPAPAMTARARARQQAVLAEHVRQLGCGTVPHRRRRHQLVALAANDGESDGLPETLASTDGDKDELTVDEEDVVDTGRRSAALPHRRPASAGAPRMLNDNGWQNQHKRLRGLCQPRRRRSASTAAAACAGRCPATQKEGQGHRAN